MASHPVVVDVAEGEDALHEMMDSQDDGALTKNAIKTHDEMPTWMSCSRYLIPLTGAITAAVPVPNTSKSYMSYVEEKQRQRDQGEIHENLRVWKG